MPTPGPHSAYPSDPALYRGHLCNVLTIPSTDSDVVDLTGYIECGTFVASGGYGQIFKGKWKDVGGAAFANSNALPCVAVKVVSVPPLRDEREKEKRLKRMKRELVLWSSLRHDNILPLIGIASMNNDANLPAFVSPWMQNGSVADFLKENPTFPVAAFLRGIIEGLYYLHTFDPEVIHGDIKAANVLVNHRKEAYLCDFGLSRFTVDNTLWRTTATHSNGTLRWMAPELLEGEACVPTKASDIYAYGLTCYEILAGKPPFDSVRNDVAIIRKVMNGERPDRIESCHADAWAIITQCWAQEADDRPSTKDVLKSVRRFTLSIVQPSAVVRGTSEGSVGTVPVPAPRRVSPSPVTFSAEAGPDRQLEPPRPLDWRPPPYASVTDSRQDSVQRPMAASHHPRSASLNADQGRQEDLGQYAPAAVVGTQGPGSIPPHLGPPLVSRTRKKPSPAAIMYSQAMLARQNDSNKQHQPRSISSPTDPARGARYLTAGELRGVGRTQNAADAQIGQGSNSHDSPGSPGSAVSLPSSSPEDLFPTGWPPVPNAALASPGEKLRRFVDARNAVARTQGPGLVPALVDPSQVPQSPAARMYLQALSAMPSRDRPQSSSAAATTQSPPFPPAEPERVPPYSATEGPGGIDRAQNTRYYSGGLTSSRSYDSLYSGSSGSAAANQIATAPLTSSQRQTRGQQNTRDAAAPSLVRRAAYRGTPN